MSRVSSHRAVEVDAAASVRIACSKEKPVPDWVTCDIPRVEQEMMRYVESLGLPANLCKASKYALLGGGKRLRPVLTIQSCLAVGGKVERCLHAAAAVEMIHAFSLVHDDLPALDDDSLRRGKPTVHIEHGEAMAILAGDGLLSMAFGIVSEIEEPSWLSGRLTRELAHGTTNMIAGQVLDTLGGFPGELDESAKVRLIHDKKTGALIRASCRMGALCGMASAGDVDQEALDAISTYGESVGLMFQIVDDLLDVEQTTEHLGKQSSKDIEAGKLTYPGAAGIEASRTMIQRLHDLAMKSVEHFGANARGLVELCDYLAIRTK